MECVTKRYHQKERERDGVKALFFLVNHILLGKKRPK